MAELPRNLVAALRGGGQGEHGDRQRWAAEWEAQRQLSTMEQRIREEQMPAAERERLQASRAREAEIKREARRRLGLPEEEPYR